MGTVEDKVIIVTGAARGLGAAIAKDLAAEGGKLVIADVKADQAERVAGAIRDAGGQAIAVEVDVSRRDSVRSMIEKTVAEFGKLDVIFNNAGVSKVVPFLEIDDAEWDRTMKINAFGVLLCMQEAAQQMIKQGHGGKIINTSSIGGKQGYPLFATYNASKFAVAALTQAGARALGEHKITVNCFGPGIVATEMWEELDVEFREKGVFSEPNAAIKDYSSTIILGRPATPTDVVGTTRFLASAASDYMTGQTVMIDGGMVLI
ncbi:glucose 1-dehydrogenase [Paraburkholderia sp. J12]|uniref:SDR family NAD(P)-dependent oxidoreductase n=1 Tax=Paraburkholderia sp. J12 TaxID=2805432 RepID=UPI002ABD814A|nr:glucose 1-dehydrogenase [Paraburkholderia sp. J12]